jgi:hypothetical protein
MITRGEWSRDAIVLIREAFIGCVEKPHPRPTSGLEWGTLVVLDSFIETRSSIFVLEMNL